MILMRCFQDLNAYLRGINIPPHRFSEIADRYLLDNQDRYEALESSTLVRMMATSCRAYTKLVLRLRAQGELEQLIYEQHSRERALRGARDNPSFESTEALSPPVPTKTSPHRRRRSISTSRSVSRNHHRRPSAAGSVANSIISSTHDARFQRFRSPLHRLGHAPLLRVLVPSPEGHWLSDSNVIRCEEELRAAGVTHLLKVGDVVWDVAVGEDGNLGKFLF